MTPTPRILALLLLALLTASPIGNAVAQGFNDLYTGDGVDVIAVGDAGVVYRSLDGGASWSETALGPHALRGVTGRGFTLLVAGDDGMVWTSVDAGGHWSSITAPSSPALEAVAMPSDSMWIVAGGNGTILRTTDAGALWTSVPSGTSQTLNALHFTDAVHGWAAGNGGVLLSTSNGGGSWGPVASGTTHALLAVDQRGATVWVAGAEGVARRSLDAGGSFSAVDLKLDARADVRGVTMLSADTLWLVGGGGFIRYSSDGGSTWTFQRHPMMAPISRLVALGDGAWAVNTANRVVMSTGDRGATWQMPTGATVSHDWGAAPRYALTEGATRGNGLALHPVYKSAFYCGIGYGVVCSRDDGETWQAIATFPNMNDACNAFLVSPRDSNLWLAALSGGQATDRIFRTTDGGATWTSVLTGNFGEFGVPLEMDLDHPDTVLFGRERNTPIAPQRSVDFGATWAPITTAAFRSPCDLLIIPDTSGIVLVNDGVDLGNGRIYKSTDGGATFTVKATLSSPEAPMLAVSRLRPNVVFGTIWPGGGVVRSSDYGETWLTVDDEVEPWGIDIARDDPNLVVYAQYSSPFLTGLSLDGGDTFTDIAPPPGFGANFAFLARDRATILASQSSGIWKLRSTYGYTPATPTQAVQLASPNGGESWRTGEQHEVLWTATGVAVVRIEYRTNPVAPWQRVADVAAHLGRYAWTVSAEATSQAEIRVWDLWDGDPVDACDGAFTIVSPALAVDRPTNTQFELGQSRPNPFSSLTRIPYSLHRATHVRLEVYDLRGGRVATLVDGWQPAGRHEATFDRGNSAARSRVGAGVYFYRLQADSRQATRKLLLLD